MQYESLIELLQQGGFTIYILLLCSILSLKVAIEKLIKFQGVTPQRSESIMKLVREYVAAGEFAKLTDKLKRLKWKKVGMTFTSPLTPALVYILENRHLPKDDLIDTAFSKLDKEIINFEKGLGIHATLGSITPFIGLFGTVIGIIKSFSALSLQDTANYSRVINGIAEALIATAAGLFVAIPSVMFYNYFTKRLKMQMAIFDDVIRETAVLVKNQQLTEAR